MKRYVFGRGAGLRPVPGAPVGLALEEVDAPKPRAGEVLVAIRANSLNFVDLNCFSGAFPVDGRIPLLDGTGVLRGRRGRHASLRSASVASPAYHWLARVLPRPESAKSSEASRPTACWPRR
ncbi:MAG: hypothetical protein R3E53_14010 [Myxococcota bacterium]